MKNQKGKISIASVIITIILLFALVKAYGYYQNNNFNAFTRATIQKDQVTFTRDKAEKYSDAPSYKIINTEYNDSAIVKEIEVEPNTPYRISCMVKTEDVVCKNVDEDGGVCLGLMGTTEYSNPIIGTNDWQKIEYEFNSKNRDKVTVSYRIGGNITDCKGTAWFSDFKLEKGTKREDNNWKVACFIIKEVDVNINGKRFNLKVNTTDIDNVRLNMERYAQDCYKFSKEQMTVDYEIFEIEEPLTKISYYDEHGYYFDYDDVKDLVYKTAKENNFDHIFVVCRMENESGTISIPINDNWIGLGGMDMYGIGYSLVRINKNGNTYVYKFGITNQAPEEVYLHEFLHTLERNDKEYGYEIPALHDYEKYGYSENALDGLNDWYKDYMLKEIYDSNTKTYIGLDSFVYETQPANSSSFKYPIEIEINKEPENIFEEISMMLKTLFNRSKIAMDG